MTAHAPDEPASAWVQRWAHLVPERGSVLDVACGSGRHFRYFTERGCAVTGVDRDAAATAPLAALGQVVVADIETGPWPFTGRQFDAVVVVRYLWRPLWAALVACVAPGGVLICETFAGGQETVGRPANPDFLLRPGELLTSVTGLRVVAFEDGFEPGSLVRPPRYTQRIVAARASAGPVPAERYPLP